MQAATDGRDPVRESKAKAFSRPAPGRSSGPQSVGRVIGILEMLALNPQGASLTEMGRGLSAPITSLVGLLRSLQELEYVIRREDRYTLGPAVSAFVLSFLPKRAFLDLGRPALIRLMRQTGETALLGVMTSEGDGATYADVVESDNPVRYTVPSGEKRELYCSAVGKCFLAFFDDISLARYLRGHTLVARTPRTITRLAELKAELRRIRQTGLAVSDEERVVGASAVAAPVLSPDGTPIAALVVGAPSARFRASRARYSNAVKEAAADLSLALGMDIGSNSVPPRRLLLPERT